MVHWIIDYENVRKWRSRQIRMPVQGYIKAFELNRLPHLFYISEKKFTVRTFDLVEC